MRTVLLIGIAAAAAFVALLWTFQRRLIYLPSTAPLPPGASFILGAEDVAFLTEDGLRLPGWFVPGSGGGERRAAVLVLNGNGGDRSYRTALAENLAAAGMSVLLFDYRGYAGNPGSPTEQGIVADARAARAYLESRDDVDPQRLILLGESLGSGAAVALAVERAPAALVLRSPFTSLVDAARAHFPWLPVGLMLRDRFPSLDRIGAVGCPVFVVAGDADTVVPVSQSRRLHEAAAEPKGLVVVPGADHNDPDFSRGATWVDELVGFLREHGVLHRPGTDASAQRDPDAPV